MTGDRQMMIFVLSALAIVLTILHRLNPLDSRATFFEFQKVLFMKSLILTRTG